jgi:uncharacterized protein (DUF305 family)
MFHSDLMDAGGSKKRAAIRRPPPSAWRAAQALVIALSIATAVGCDDSAKAAEPDDCNSEAYANAYFATKDQRVPFAPQDDTQFIDTMVPHHEMAVMMADMELEHGSNAGVKAMVQMMKDAQLAEIAEMKASRQEIAGSSDIPKMDDAHMKADMQAMESLRGAELDRHFLEEMLPHHAGALVVAHGALPNLENADMRALAAKIVQDQTEEIVAIKDALAGL